MGFWDVVGKVATTLIEEGAKSKQETYKRAASKINDYEKKIANAEKSSKMNNPEYAKKVKEAKEQLKKAKVKMYTGGSSSSDNVKTNSNGQVIIGDYAIEQWDKQWRSLGTLSKLALNDLSPYNHSIGLYKAEMGGKIYYIGRAIEYNNGGFRKRLRDYVRDSNSARTHKSGGKMNENADRITISILVMGDSEKHVEDVKILEKSLIIKHAPQWNFQFNS